MPFHPADGTPGTAEQLGVAVVKVIEIAPQLFPCGGRTAARYPEQGRVRNDAAPHHDAGQLRVLLFQHVQVGGSEGRTVGLSAVLLTHHARVDGQLTDGILVINVQNGGKLLRLVHTQPGLDRDGPLRIGEHGSKEGIQLCKVPQHPGTLALGRYRAGWTAEVQIHLGVAQFAQFADHPCGQLSVLCQQLRDHRCAGVGCGGQFGHLLFDEYPVLRRGEKRGIIAVGSTGGAEPFLVRLPPHPVGQALHGGSVVVHEQISKMFDRAIVA